jgi:putative NADH-flavin reductase
MKLTILGATGATGTQLTERALAAGHQVTAVVRDPARLAVRAQPGLRTITADVMDPDSIADAIAGADAVISAVGPRGTGPTTVIQDSVRSIITAMDKTGTRRLLQVSGSIVADDGESPYLRYLVKPLARRTFLRHVCADMRHGEEQIRRTDLDWTIIRPPALTSRPAQGTYRTAAGRNLPHAFTISRADLAAWTLTLITDPAAVRKHLSIAN